MTPPPSQPDRHDALSRREREILDLVYARGEATAAEVHGDMAEAPSYSAVRGLIRVLVEKGHLAMRKEGLRNVYRPTRSKRSAGPCVPTTGVDPATAWAAAPASGTGTGAPAWR